MSLNLMLGRKPSTCPRTFVLNTLAMLELNSRTGKMSGRMSLLKL
jgi:hypothetical protein